MKFSEFEKSVQSPAPVYVLLTDQTYLQKKVYEFSENQVEEDGRAFNWSVFDLEEDSISEVINRAKTLPWVAEYRWIYVKNADQAGKDFKGYLENPSLKTVLILEVLKRPRGWPELPTIELSKSGNILQWMMRKANEEGYELEPAAAETLLELVGDDYQRLDAELEKLILWEMEGRSITVDSVLLMTSQAREHDVFTLINALASQRAERALRVLNRLYDTGMSVPQILALLYWNFRRVLVAKELLDQGRPFQSLVRELKIWSYKNREKEIHSYSNEVLSGILIALRETDRLAKTTSTDARIHLERVIVDTCRVRSL